MNAAQVNSLSLRVQERASIRAFLEKHKMFLRGRVLDFGCGLPGKCLRPSPYRDLVLTEYVPYDLGYPAYSGRFSSVLCTQVLQYVNDPLATLAGFFTIADFVVLTYPTHWEEVERTDLHRFTKEGMEDLVNRGGGQVLVHEERWRMTFTDFFWVGGYGLVAQTVGTQRS